MEKKPDYPFVCAETAVKLRDIGMPQPAKAHGQVWYIRSSNGWQPMIVFYTRGELRWQCAENILENITDNAIGPNESAYAPTADYILEQLGPWFYLNKTIDNAHWVVMRMSGDKLNPKRECFDYHTVSASEALANAYLQKKALEKIVPENPSDFKEGFKKGMTLDDLGTFLGRNEMATHGAEWKQVYKPGMTFDEFLESAAKTRREMEKLYSHANFPHPTLDDIKKNLGKEFTTKRIALLDTGEFVKYDVCDAQKEVNLFGTKYTHIGSGWIFSCNGVVEKCERRYLHFFRRKATRPEDVE